MGCGRLSGSWSENCDPHEAHAKITAASSPIQDPHEVLEWLPDISRSTCRRERGLSVHVEDHGARRIGIQGTLRPSCCRRSVTAVYGVRPLVVSMVAPFRFRAVQAAT